MMPVRLYAIEHGDTVLGQYPGRTPGEALQSLAKKAGTPLSEEHLALALTRFKVTPVRRGETEYNFNDLAGCVAQRRCQETGTLVGLYHGVQAGQECDPETPWTTVCEDHGTLVGHGTLKQARDHLGHPTNWCDACREKKAP